MKTSGWTKYVIFFVVFAAFFYTLQHSLAHQMSLYSDDFYYYSNVASNLARGAGSTYNGLVATNGYHPLWLWMLSAVYYLADSLEFSSLMASRIFIAIISAASTVLIYQFVTRQNSSSIASVFVAFFSCIYYVLFAITGMEIIISIPIFVWLLIELQRSDLHYFKVGLLAGLIALSRIDAVIVLSILLLTFIILNKTSWKNIVKIFLGGLPFLIYLASNILIFDSLFPVSGLAKSVATVSGLNSATFESILISNLFPLNSLALLTVATLCILSVKNAKRTSNTVKAFMITAALSLPIFYIQNSIRSDWPLWDWYFYPFLFSILLSAPSLRLVNTGAVIDSESKVYGAVTLSLLVIFSLYTVYKVTIPRTRPIVETAFEIRAFEADHPGIYAMGDRAGAVGHLLGSPLVQLEGLVMDREYIDRLQSTERIEDLLADYAVDFYIASNPKDLGNGCYGIVEPAQSRGKSFQLESEICWPVAISIVINSRPSKMHSEQKRTIIFRNPASTTT